MDTLRDLHHQGDLGKASYAAVSLLVEVGETRARDWNLYGLIATIEVEVAFTRAEPCTQMPKKDASRDDLP